jgi:hypothetical protein
MICAYSKCNNEFEKKSNRQLFCTTKCQWQNRDLIHPEYKKRSNDKNKLYKRKWKEIKAFNGNATLINKKCYLCKAKENLIIHHNDGNNGKMGKPLNNDSDNLIILCRPCHPKIHNRWWRKDIYAYSNR